jgi:hypothetical protein
MLVSSLVSLLSMPANSFRKFAHHPCLRADLDGFIGFAAIGHRVAA